MFILSDGDFFDDDGSQGIINGINNNCQYDTGLSQKKLLTSTLSGFDIVYAVGMAAQTSKILTWKSEIFWNF